MRYYSNAVLSLPVEESSLVVVGLCFLTVLPLCLFELTAWLSSAFCVWACRMVMAKARFLFFLFFPCACGDGTMLCTCCPQLWEDKTLNTSILPDDLNIRSLEGSKGSEINAAVKWLRGLDFSERGKQLFLQWGSYGGGLCREWKDPKLHSLGKIPKHLLIQPIYFILCISSFVSCKKSPELNCCLFSQQVRASPHCCSHWDRLVPYCAGTN